MQYIQKRKKQVSGIAPSRRKIYQSIRGWQAVIYDPTTTDDQVLQACLCIENLESQL